MHIGTFSYTHIFCYLLVTLEVLLGQVLILLQLKFSQFWFGIGRETEEKSCYEKHILVHTSSEGKMQHLNFAKIDMYCIPIRAAKCLREHIILHIYLVKKWPIIVNKTYTSDKKKVLACKSELCAFISL